MAWLTPPAAAFLAHPTPLNLGQTNLLYAGAVPRPLEAFLYGTHHRFANINGVTPGHWPHNTLTVPIGGGGAGAAPAGYAT